MFTKSNSPKQKIFCIGQIKTGTTSLGKFFQDHGYTLGDQDEAQHLLDAYIQRDWKPILEYFSKSDCYSDNLIGDEYVYVLLDQYFPNSKFILTERDSAEQWYNSLINQITKQHGKGNKLPTEKELSEHSHVYEGFAWKYLNEKFWNKDGKYLDKAFLEKTYLERNLLIEKYFRKKNNFLKINLAEKSSFQSLIDFLNISPLYQEFPHENKSVDLA